MTDPDYPVEDWFPLLWYGDDDAETRFRIVTAIFGHPTELPAEQELRYKLTATNVRDTDVVQAELDVLCDAGVVTRIETEAYTFYGLTNSGKQFVIDTAHYSGNVVFDFYGQSTRPDDIEAAFCASRPAHPPVTDHYEEQQYPDSDTWVAGRAAAFRKLSVGLERVDETTFEARLIEGDTETTLVTETVAVENPSERMTDEYRTMAVYEGRGAILDDDKYAIEVERNGSRYEIRPEKAGANSYIDIERSLFIFTDD